MQLRQDHQGQQDFFYAHTEGEQFSSHSIAPPHQRLLKKKLPDHDDLFGKGGLCIGKPNDIGSCRQPAAGTDGHGLFALETGPGVRLQAMAVHIEEFEDGLVHHIRGLYEKAAILDHGRVDADGLRHLQGEAEDIRVVVLAVAVHHHQPIVECSVPIILIGIRIILLCEGITRGGGDGLDRKSVV